MTPTFALSFRPFSGGRERASPRGLSAVKNRLLLRKKDDRISVNMDVKDKRYPFVGIPFVFVETKRCEDFYQSFLEFFHY